MAMRASTTVVKQPDDKMLFFLSLDDTDSGTEELFCLCSGSKLKPAEKRTPVAGMESGMCARSSRRNNKRARAVILHWPGASDASTCFTDLEHPSFQTNWNEFINWTETIAAESLRRLGLKLALGQSFLSAQDLNRTRAVVRCGCAQERGFVDQIRVAVKDRAAWSWWCLVLPGPTCIAVSRFESRNFLIPEGR